MRRQLYVMDTYVTGSNRRTNHSMMLIHSYLSWAVVIPATTGEVCFLYMAYTADLEMLLVSGCLYFVKCGWNCECSELA